MKRIILSLLVITLALVGFSFSASAEEEESSAEAKLEIVAGNLSFEENVKIVYAVSSQNVNSANIKMLYWTTPMSCMDSYVKGSENYSSAPLDNDAVVDGVACKVFKYDNIWAKEMTDTIYARAYVEENGFVYYSNVVKYSILQYAYNMLGYTAEASDNEELKATLVEMLEYGAAAQLQFDYKTETLATDKFSKIELIGGGTFVDGFAHALLKVGDEAWVVAPENDANGATFSYWKDITGNILSREFKCTITVASVNQRYTPVYVKYSSGLEFDSNGDGTCYIIGMGDCNDTALVIPPKSPENDTVIGIDSSAFAGEAITSVSFPNTIQEIARRAFNGCDSITDIYYDGTEAEWGEISISSGNDPIENATKHFTATMKYTVTFVDYNGATLKAEIVESGKSATAPDIPTREGYSFVGWDKAFDNITNDMTVTAQYEKSYTKPTFVVQNVTAGKGDTVTVAINVKNNPGILAMTLSLTYDDSALDLTSVSNGAALSALTMTPSKTLSSGCKFAWDGLEITEDDVIDGEILVLTFAVSDSAANGAYDIVISYTEGDIYDNDINTLSFEIENGTITVN